MQNTTSALEPETHYHIYNRANGDQIMFANHGNYHYFLAKFQQYIAPISKTFCYCLMPNHFHFLIQLKTEDELRSFFKSKKLINENHANLSGFISQQFSNFFNAYSKAFNKQQNRKGSLFMRPFKRKKITNKHYFYKLVHYIHNNPTEAGLCKSINEWKYSSYNSICSGDSDLLDQKGLMEWFHDLENFKFVQKQKSFDLAISFDDRET